MNKKREGNWFWFGFLIGVCFLLIWTAIFNVIVFGVRSAGNLYCRHIHHLERI